MHLSANVIAILGAAATISLAASSRTRRQVEVPGCALSCLQSVEPGECLNLNDLQCLCGSTRYVTLSSRCIVNRCSAVDASSAFETLRATCSSVGVTLPDELPPPDQPSSTASSNQVSSTPSATPSGKDNSNGGETSNTPNDKGDSSEKSSTPVGAIVGGVIGGLIVIVAGVVAIYFLKQKHTGPPVLPASSLGPNVVHTTEYPHFQGTPTQYPIVPQPPVHTGHNNAYPSTHSQRPPMHLQAVNEVVDSYHYDPYKGHILHLSAHDQATGSATHPVAMGEHLPGLTSPAISSTAAPTRIPDVVDPNARVLLHEDSGVRLRPPVGNVVEVPPIYSP